MEAVWKSLVAFALLAVSLFMMQRAVRRPREGVVASIAGIVGFAIGFGLLWVGVVVLFEAVSSDCGFLCLNLQD